MAKSPILTSPEADFPRWYQEVIAKAELAENGPARGTMVIRPDGYAIWERMQAEVDARIKAVGVRNAYFPLFIPESYLTREAEHVEGFSPELAIVTHGGGKELAEPLVVRPTSETVIGESMARWIQSYRDLPLLLNQWANVVRWEMRPRLFLRSSEFLWQEGHTAHASRQDAAVFARRIHQEVYRDFMTEVLAMPVLIGAKTAAERFPGAIETLTCEAMMGDGKALQMGTSHELGQNFAHAFSISYLDAEGAEQLAWTTSWGVSTRMVGGLIMTHGDESGLRLPPRLAPIQAMVLVVREGEGVSEAAATLVDDLERLGVRAAIDARTDVSFGRRTTDWELKGVPIRIELGPRDLANGEVTLVRRDLREKQPCTLDRAVATIETLLTDIQDSLYREALDRTEANTVEVSTVAEAVEAAASGFARIPWDQLGPHGESELAQSAVTVRCLQRADGALPEDGTDEGLIAIVARSY